MSDSQFYTVRPGDTMSEVATRFGTTVKELCKINGLDNPDEIEAGEVIALNARAVCKVAVVLIDWDRNPIVDARVRIEYCGKLKEFTTKANGSVTEILTETPGDIVKVFIARPDGTWEIIAEVPSGWGNKLVTLKSPKLRIQSETRPHPKDDSGAPMPDSRRAKSEPITPPTAPKTTMADGRAQANFGDGKGPKTKVSTSRTEVPVTKVTNDQVSLDFLDNFNGELLSNSDYEWAARELGVEEALIRAICEVEAQGKGFTTAFQRKVPKIQFERHLFYRFTKGIYTANNREISWKAAYYQKGVRYVSDTFTCADRDGKSQTFDYWRRYSTKKDRKRVDCITRKPVEVKHGKELFDTGVATREVDSYADAQQCYRRLVKAYALDREAALRSCSWGAFQILGDNYKAMKYISAADFVKAMSRSEREQIRALILYFKYVKPNAIKAMKKKDFQKIAAGFNGAAYKDNNYDVKLKQSYNKWRGK